MSHNDIRQILEKSSAEWFKKKGCPTRPEYPYILKNRSDWRKNIILPEVFDYVMERKQARNYPFPLHDWLHHGLSSQAMLFNLFGPLVVKNSLVVLAEPFREAGVIFPKQIDGEFEYQDRLAFNELQTQPTSLDFVITDHTKEPKILIEAKLVEKGFGYCSQLQNTVCSGLNPANGILEKECELVSIGREYWKVLIENDVLTEEALKGPTCPLAVFYQFYREVGFAVKTNAQLVFLVDERNPFFSPSTDSSLPNRLIKSLKPTIQQKVKIVTIQRIFAEIAKFFKGENWVENLAEKYNLNTPK